MSLADRRTEPDTRSKFEKWVDGLSDNNKKIVTGWLHDLTVSNVKIIQWIRDDDPEDDFIGYAANKDSVADWRRKHVAR